MDKNALTKCILFRGFDERQLALALDFFEAEFRFFPRGSFLNRISAPLTRFGLVLSGTVRVYRDDVNGHHMILANVGAGETFGESLCWLGRAPMSISAVTNVGLCWLKARTQNPRRAWLCRAAARGLYQCCTPGARYERPIQILSNNNTRKLMAFFTVCTRGSSNCFEVP